MPSISVNPFKMSANNFDTHFTTPPIKYTQLPSVKKDAAILTPNDSEIREQEIKMIIKSVDALEEIHNDYINDYVARGNQNLYELLSHIYAVAVQIENSDYRDAILKKLRNHLSLEKKIKTQKNSNALTMIVRWIVGASASRQLAFTYSKALEAAFIDNITAEKLVKYLTDLGGINNAAKKHNAQKTVKADTKQQHFKKFMLTADTQHHSFENTKIKWTEEVHGNMTSDFSMILCFSNGGGNFQGLRAFNLSLESYNKICKILADDLFKGKNDVQAAEWVDADLQKHIAITSQKQDAKQIANA